MRLLRGSARHVLGAHVLGAHALGAVALICAWLAPPVTTWIFAAAQAEAAPVSLKVRIAVYRKKLAEYTKAHDAYEKLAGPYWSAVSEKRSRRRAKMAKGQALDLDDYVAEQPAVYSGPPKPKDPQEEKRPKPREIPDAADFLAHAKEQFGFTPQAPAAEIDYKRAYAKVAAAAGLNKEACVKIYGFESGGNGTYDIQAGREYNPNAKVISTALGYNQLLNTNTVELLAEAGAEFLAALSAMAEGASGERNAQLQDKIAKLKKMIAFSRTVPDDWNEHGKLAGTPKGLGIHALNLDVDVGPLLQTQKLLTSVIFATKKGYTAPLTAAELEMMNLTGDGNGYDMLAMSAELREVVPTSNFFQRGGYERNPVAARNNTVAKLLAATDATMSKESGLQGAKDLAAAFDGVK